MLSGIKGGLKLRSSKRKRKQQKNVQQKTEDDNLASLVGRAMERYRANVEGDKSDDDDDSDEAWGDDEDSW